VKRTNLLSEVKKTVGRYRLLQKNDKVLIALSGGADSVVLLTLLLELKHTFGLSFHLAHLNHCLRGRESDEDAEWTEALAGRLAIPITIEKRNVLEWARREGYSLEEGARKVRYAFLSNAADKVNATKIATGHTLDDQAETVLLRLLRGTGLSGLAAIAPKRGRVIRPLIELTRQEIVGYLRAKGVEYRRDSSNLQLKYPRNRLRLELIPFLKKEFNAKITELLGRYGELAYVDNSYLETVARGAFSTVLILRNVSIKSKHILSSLELSTGKRLELPSGLILTRQYENLVISLTERKCEAFSYGLCVPGTVVLKETGMTLVAEFLDRDFLPKDSKSRSPEEVYFDFDRIHLPLIVRNRRIGDRMHPLGMKGERKLKDILIDDKIPRNERERIPLLVDTEGLLWIIGNRRSERAKITDVTERIVRIRAAADRI